MHAKQSFVVEITLLSHVWHAAGELFDTFNLHCVELICHKELSGLLDSLGIGLRKNKFKLARSLVC